jgi:hypothetical protein
MEEKYLKGIQNVNRKKESIFITITVANEL